MGARSMVALEKRGNWRTGDPRISKDVTPNDNQSIGIATMKPEDRSTFEAASSKVSFDFDATTLRQHRLTIYLAKEGDWTDDRLIDLASCKPAVPINVHSGTATLYVKTEKPKTSPAWCQFFTSHQALEEGLFGKTNTVGAAFLLRDHNRAFILTFGTGHHLVNDDFIERDFGLRVTLNSVEPDKLRSLDKASYQSDPLNSRTQSPKEVGIFELHVDSELELVYAITGTSKVEVFGTNVTGRDALTIKRSITIEMLSEVLGEALNRYVARLPAEFEWFDNVARVKDLEEIEIADLELDQVLAKKDYSVVLLGEPEVVDWETNLGYAYNMYMKSGVHVVLELEDLIAHLGLGEEALTVEALRNSKVHIVDSGYHSIKQWSAYRCLYAEVKYGGKLYILRNGEWFRAAEDFVKVIDNYLAQAVEKYPHELPTYQHDREEDYNKFVADGDIQYWLMDKKNVRIGGPFDKIEFCDLIRAGSDFIHVKYYRASGTLSHLFSQALVGGNTYLGDEAFRKKLNEQLPLDMKLADTVSRPDVGKYMIVYAIATAKALPIELPFFSKVTLKHASKALRTLGYKVALSAVTVDPLLLKKRLIKPVKTRST